MNKKPVLIVEHCMDGLKPVNETKSGKKDYILSGTFTEFNVKNRNERIYTAEKFIPHLNELMGRKQKMGVVYGEFDHPDVFDTSLSRVSHTIENTTFDRESNSIKGEIRLLNTHWGKEAKALVDDGCPIFVSSRAAGITESDGTVTVKKLFTYDAVADPGFSSARMEVKSLNESLGFTEPESNFRIYDISDENKINELFTMNKNDETVTKTQMLEYSNYLTDEIEKFKISINEAITTKNEFAPEKLTQMLEYYDTLQTQQTKIGKYLDYLAEKLQVVVEENIQLKETSTKLIEHNDYLAENLEKVANYSEYIAETLDKNIDYGKYIAETLDKNIDFSEYIAEHVDKNIKYSEYIAESLDKSIDYQEYIAENLDNTIVYSEYIAENLDNTIVYSEYIAENLDNTIIYSEYIAEHVDNNISYSEYIAENLDDSMAYTNYIAESLDKTIENSKLITENKTNEALDNNFKVDDVSKYYEDNIPTAEVEEDEEEDTVDQSITDEIPVEEPVDGEGIEEAPIEGEGIEEAPIDGEGIEEAPIDGEGIEGIPGETGVEAPVSEIDVPVGDIADGTIEPDGMVDAGIEEVGMGEETAPVTGNQIGDVIAVGDGTGEIVATGLEGGYITVKMDTADEPMDIHESKVTYLGTSKLTENEKSLKENINSLILETKKRKVSEQDQPNFLLFLTEKRKASYYALSNEDKIKVKLSLKENEGNYMNEAQVLGLMNEALSPTKRTFNELLLEAMPSELQPVWEKLDESIKTQVLTTSRLFPTLDTVQKFENFWLSRHLERFVDEKPSKTLITENHIVDDSKLSESQIDRFKSVFDKLNS